MKNTRKQGESGENIEKHGKTRENEKTRESRKNQRKT